jgi:hypothetical protein
VIGREKQRAHSGGGLAHGGKDRAERDEQRDGETQRDENG